MRLLLFSLMLVLSFSVKANFSYNAELEMQLLNGEHRKQHFPLSLTREAGVYLFKVGTQNARLPAPPQKYALTVVLQQDRELWVPDFIDKPLQAFKLSIAGHEISLKREPQAKAARGQFVLQFGKDTYYFGRGPAQINFNLNENGIAEVEIRGMFKPGRQN